jgi:transcriptional regulator with XRE-family HTH domain
MQTQVQIREQIAARLKLARERAGYSSSEEFCQRNGLEVREYSRHENGSKAIKASQAIKYSQLLHTSLYWLMLGEENIKAARREKSTN